MLMAHDLTLIRLYEDAFGCAPAEVTPLAGAGSNRCYYLLTSCDASWGKVVGTVGTDASENRAFIALSQHFRKASLPVPEVYAVSADGMAYLQQWVGEKSLFDAIADGREKGGRYSEAETALVRKAVEMLPPFNFRGAEGLDFSICFPEQSMHDGLIANDIAYFKYSFLKVSGIEFDEVRLDGELRHLASDIGYAVRKSGNTFMIRDFQSRNVMLLGDEPYLIDFQGGRRGPAAYDLASFLWQARARFSSDMKRTMVDAYIVKAHEVSSSFDESAFRHNLPVMVLFRILQTLGAYGFRGWTERKPHFLRSIPSGVDNLLDFFLHPLDDGFASVAADYPYLKYLAEQLTDASKVADLRMLVTVPAVRGLTVTVSSFSYKRGVPYDLSGNGGGFVFDCRAVHNPGRYEQYKPLTGMDRPVIDFLEKNGEIFTFLDSCELLVDASVERYLSRGFTSLSVSFGCTGGRHRSVYSAEAMAKHLASKYPQVQVALIHREQRKLRIFPPLTK